jgi:hypothetical protein
MEEAIGGAIVKGGVLYILADDTVPFSSPQSKRLAQA